MPTCLGKCCAGGHAAGGALPSSLFLSFNPFIQRPNHMKRLLLALAGLSFLLSAAAQDNIVKSLERNVPGQGKVTIHQDERIEALLGRGAVPSSTGERKTLRAAGYRVQVYAGSNTRQAKNEAYAVATRIPGPAGLFLLFPSTVAVPRGRLSECRGGRCHDAQVAGYRRVQGSFHCPRPDSDTLMTPGGRLACRPGSVC